MSENNESLKMLLLYAMQAEADPFIEVLGLERRESCWHPFRVYSGRDYEGHELTVMTSGIDEFYSVDNVATQNAAVMAAMGIKTYQPHVVINAGTAGGFKACGAKIGEVFIGNNFVYHDRRIPIPGFSSFGIGGFQFSPPAEFCSEFRKAVITTGNSLDITANERRVLMELAKGYVVVKEMEATAIAEMCFQARVPLIAIKAITDLVDGERCSQDEFMQNLQLASHSLQGAVACALRHISNGLVRQITQARNHWLVDVILALFAEK